MKEPAITCDDCGAIVARGDEKYPDNHWEWCTLASLINEVNEEEITE